MRGVFTVVRRDRNGGRADRARQDTDHRGRVSYPQDPARLAARGLPAMRECGIDIGAPTRKTGPKPSDVAWKTPQQPTLRGRACRSSFSPSTKARPDLFYSGLPISPHATAQQEFQKIYPGPGQVEHDPETIWATTLATMRGTAAYCERERDCSARDHQSARPHSFGIVTGRPIHNACGRTVVPPSAVQPFAGRAAAADFSAHRPAADPYFSAP